MACPFAAFDAQPSHPFASRPKHPPLGSSASSHASSSGSSCPFSSKGEAGSTRPLATDIPPLSDPSPLSDSVSLLPPHPTAAPSSTLSGPLRLPDVLPAGPQPSRLTASHPLRPPSAALHSALHGFRALNASYAYEEYSEAFNWSELDLGLETEGVWYCVAFRSKRMPGTENDLALYEADKAAHEEALEQGQSSLLLYWYGRPDAHGVNLATCIWESRAQARLANSRPHHLNAVRLTARSYESYTLERYALRKIAGERELRVEPYVEWEDGSGGASVAALPAVRSAPSAER